MEDNGFDAVVENVQDMSIIKIRYQVPPELQSCHTAIVDGYVIEGHVPVTEINRLLAERPDIVGLAVPGMPVGAPGMEVETCLNLKIELRNGARGWRRRCRSVMRRWRN